MIYNSELNARVIYADSRPSSAGDYDAIVLKNIDPATEAGRIFIDLETLGYRVHSIRNAMNVTTRRAAPVFFVELVKAPFNANIFGIKRIANQNVIIEKNSMNSEMVRCSNCQGLDHLAEDCSSSPICAWCGGLHLTRYCIIGGDLPTHCSKCGGLHPSNSKACNIYRQRFFEAKMKKFWKVKEMNESQENLKKLPLEEESMVVQYDVSLSGNPSSVSCDGFVSEKECPMISAMSFTHDVIQMDYLKKTLKLTLDHYLSMQYMWRGRILRIEL